MSCLYLILRSISSVRNYHSSNTYFFKLTPISVPKSLENAPSQVLTELRQWLLTQFFEYRIVSILTCGIRRKFPWFLRLIRLNSVIKRETLLLLPNVKCVSVSATHLGSYLRSRYNKTWSMVKSPDLKCNKCHSKSQ